MQCSFRAAHMEEEHVRSNSNGGLSGHNYLRWKHQSVLFNRGSLLRIKKLPRQHISQPETENLFTFITRHLSAVGREKNLGAFNKNL